MEDGEGVESVRELADALDVVFATGRLEKKLYEPLDATWRKWTQHPDDGTCTCCGEETLNHSNDVRGLG